VIQKGIVIIRQYRIEAHNQGEGVAQTAKRRSVTLVYHETFTNLGDAVKREHQVKKWSRTKEKAFIRGNGESLKMLSKSQ
jgi:predicted GIY-YIG superfamily endonuclease